MSLLKKLKSIVCRKDKSAVRHAGSSQSLSVFDAIYDNQDCFFKVHTTMCIDRLSGLFHKDINLSIASPVYGLARTIIGSGSRSEAFNYLEDYYQSVNETVVSSERYVVLSDGNADGSLSEFKLPWEGYGRISHKTRLYGPVHKDYINSEIDRVYGLLRSIEEKDYSPNFSDDPIRGYLLVKDDDYRLVVKGGQHRVAVLSALGFDEVDVTWQPNWPRMIIRDHSKWWPHVRDGSIDEHRALDEFDRFFSDHISTRGRFVL